MCKVFMYASQRLNSSTGKDENNERKKINQDQDYKKKWMEFGVQ